MEIKSLAKAEFHAIAEAFGKAFATYDVQINKQQLQTMLKKRGFNAELSFAAFEGNDIVAFTLNGIGHFGGIPTAYDTGTGTLQEYRGRGLATQIFEYSIPFLKERNITQYLLEVLQHNSQAVSVYRNLGFEVTREFNYFTVKNEEVRMDTKSKNETFSIKPIHPAEYSDIPKFWDFYPSWQNSFESVERAADDFISLGVFSENRLAGYCIFESLSGDVTQLAVDKRYRRKGIATLLLDEMLKINKIDTIKFINTDIRCDSITAFLKARNINAIGKQFEMIKEL